VLFCCVCSRLVMCRVSDAGNEDLATRSGSRRPKTAKARNRGRYAPWPCRRLSYGGLSGERAACMPARGEGWSDCAERSRFALIASGPEKLGSSSNLWDEQRICDVHPSGEDESNTTARSHSRLSAAGSRSRALKNIYGAVTFDLEQRRCGKRPLCRFRTPWAGRPDAG
jgi:hypothetical protein